MNQRLEVERTTREILRSEIRDDLKEAVENALDNRLKHIRVLNDLLLGAQGILTAQMAGRLLGVSARTVVKKYVPAGLKLYRPGKVPLFLTEDVIEFVKAHPDSSSGRGDQEI